MLALPTHLLRHLLQAWTAQMVGQTDRQTDNIIMPIAKADHTVLQIVKVLAIYLSLDEILRLYIIFPAKVFD